MMSPQKEMEMCDSRAGRESQGRTWDFFLYQKTKKCLKKMTVCHEYARASWKASKALFIQVDTEKSDFIKIKNSCSLKTTVQKKMKRQVTD